MSTRGLQRHEKQHRHQKQVIRRTFDRFKYAEEYAYDVDEEHAPGTWRMFRDPDRVIEEDGEYYYVPVYVVEVDE